MKYHIGDIIVDDAWGMSGQIYQIDDYDSCVVLHVVWDDGTTSDFMPDESTRLLYV